MNLVLFTSSFPYGKGEQFLETEIAFLSAKFETVTIVPTTFGGGKEKRIVPNNVSTLEPVLLGKRNRFLNFKFTCLLGFYKTIIKELYSSIKSNQLPFFLSALNIAYCALSDSRIKKIMLESTNKDVHYYYWGHGLSFMLPFLEKVNAKQVMRLHRGDLYEYLHNGYFPFREYQLSACDFIVPISADGAKYLSEIYPNYNNKIKIHRLGVKAHFDISPLPVKECFNIVSCSALIPVKRVHLIIESLKTNIKGQVIWTHFGDGALMSELQKASELLPPNVTCNFVGFVSNNFLLDHYRKHPVDLFVNVSSSEGIPVSIMEAISYGIPVVATNVGGASEAITNESGRLINVDFNTSELTTIINSLIDKELIFERNKVKESWRELFDASENYKGFVDFLTALR